MIGAFLALTRRWSLVEKEKLRRAHRRRRRRAIALAMEIVPAGTTIWRSNQSGHTSCGLAHTP